MLRIPNGRRDKKRGNIAARVVRLVVDSSDIEVKSLVPTKLERYDVQRCAWNIAYDNYIDLVIQSASADRIKGR